MMLSWLQGSLSPLEAIWGRLALLSGTTIIVLLAGGLVSRRELALRHRRAPAVSAPDLSLVRTPSTGGMIDLAAELREVLAELDTIAAGSLVRLELAVEPGLIARAAQGALRQIVSDLVRSAIDQSGGGRVLVTAGRHSGAIQIAVVDDGTGGDRPAQEARLRTAEQLAALQGAALEVTVRSKHGTTTALRLPEPAASRASVPPPEKEAIPPPTIEASSRQLTI